ncbi:Thioesterase/thiol ester dehydrase-isomerase [Auricularia subglabra TFB-10046 SS5]|uniref:Thioesterase/thiol ester dehydrase-isomerase n=1 Tax=Auricularia subglabra (strain TFB-10046 / SS5) TaxID=717982 RepID=J0WWB2_AURST|nr:Thioesterase/thiol ester dehydrase-isomerase [Auricularia subglabra TFB-10046 SS5]
MSSHIARRVLRVAPRLARAASSEVSNTAAPSRGTGLRTALALTAVGATAYGLGSLYPPEVITILFPRHAPPPLPVNSPEGIAQTQALEKDMLELDYLQKLRRQDTANEWYETRPFSNIDPTLPQIQNHLILGALRAPGRLAVPPIVRARKDETEALAVIHVGRGLCGHDGIVHGGLLAMLLDEASARLALLNLPSHVGVTAHLRMDYKRPVHAGRFIVLRTKLREKKGRKVAVEATVEDLDGTVYVHSSSVFVEPKYAKMLGSGEVLKALGVPPPDPAPGLVKDA